MAGEPSILFLSWGFPPGSKHYSVSSYGGGRLLDFPQYKMSVLALVSWLRANGCEGYYHLMEKRPSIEDGLPPEIRELIETCNPDAIGLSLCTQEMPAGSQLIEMLKIEYPEIPIIAGGPHINALPEHTLTNNPLLDYVGIGDGEYTLESWLKGINAGWGKKEFRELPGLGFVVDGKCILTGPARMVEDIDDLPEPAYDLVVDPGDASIHEKPFPMLSTRGCPHSCTFCSMARNAFRCLTPVELVDRLVNLSLKYGARHFSFRDSYWPPSKKWLDEFCEEIERRKLKINFQFLTRVGYLDGQDFRKLKRAGARAIAVGVESGDNQVLAEMRKGITVEDSQRTLDDIKSAGIFSVAFFLLGNPDETLEATNKSLEAAERMNASFTFFNILSPLPGSEAYNDLSSGQKDWWLDDGISFPEISDVPVPELMRKSREAFIRHPLRLSYLMQHVFGGRLPMEFRIVCLRYFIVQLRRYTTGLLERFSHFRFIIRRLKLMRG